MKKHIPTIIAITKITAIAGINQIISIITDAIKTCAKTINQKINDMYPKTLIILLKIPSFVSL